MDSYLGQIILWALDWAPQGWVMCEGQKLAISKYPELYSILGDSYGGDGHSVFNLPDFRGRVPFGAGQLKQQGGSGADIKLGARFGKERTQITVDNMPAHDHSVTAKVTDFGKFYVSPDPAAFDIPKENLVLGAATTNALDELGQTAIVNLYREATNLVPLSVVETSKPTDVTETKETGQGIPFSSIPPVQALNYIIRIEGGIYP